MEALRGCRPCSAGCFVLALCMHYLIVYFLAGTTQHTVPKYCSSLSIYWCIVRSTPYSLVQVILSLLHRISTQVQTKDIV